jgi:hypothetical protein
MANEECRIEDYIVPECNDRGKSFSICFRIPPALWDEVNRLSREGQFPFETRPALFRWAFYRGIRSLASIKDKDKHQIPILELPFIAFQSEWPLPFTGPTFFTKLHQTVLQMKALGYSQQTLLRFANAIEEVIQCLPNMRQSISFSANADKVWKSTGIPFAEQQKARRGL